MIDKLLFSGKKSIKYRHEFKYFIDLYQLTVLKERLPKIMQRDEHVDDSGQYCIRSLYFDDYENRCYYENENGTDPREKYRIRIYNASDNKISLELKRKEQGMTLKRACGMKREQVEKLIKRDRLEWKKDMDPLMNKLFLLQETRLMTPKVIVEYDRIPFVYPEGNVRVTLDMNVRSSSSIRTFFNKSINARPVMPAGMSLLEVKYDEFLPDFIYNSIQMPSLRQTAFSKYYLCRKFGDIAL